MAEQQTPANREAAARQLQAATQRFQPQKAQGKAVVSKAVREAVAALLTPYPEPVTADLVEWADRAAALGEAFGVGDDHWTAMQMIAALARFIDGQGPDPRGVADADRDRLAVWHDAQVYNLRPALQSASFPEEIEALELATAAHQAAAAALRTMPEPVADAERERLIGLLEEGLEAERGGGLTSDTLEENVAEVIAYLRAAALRKPAPEGPLAASLNALIAESYGVAGLHLNEEIAPWEELLAGGRYEEWLGVLDEVPPAPQWTRAEDARIAKAVKGVLDNLGDRRGIKWALNDIDDDVRIEMIETLEDIVRQAITGPEDDDA